MNSTDGRIYKHIKESFCYESYLDNIQNRALRHALTKIRLSSHRYNIETGRWGKNKIPRADRQCTLCNVIEDEFHVLNICPRYVNERRGRLPEHLITNPCTRSFYRLLAASLATLASRLAPAEGRERACGASARNRPSAGGGPTGLRPVGRYTVASRPKGNRPAAGGQVHGRFAPGRKPACGRWAGTRALRARKETSLRPVGRYTGASRPKGNRPAAGGQVHGRFAPERKPAYGWWAGTRALRARKKTGLRPVGRYTGASRPKGNRPAA